MYNVLKEWINRYFGNEETVIFSAILIVGLMSILYLGDVLAPVLAAAIVAFMLQGGVTRLEQIRVPQRLAVWIVFLLFSAMIASLIFVVLPLSWRQLVNFIGEVPGLVTRIQEQLSMLPERYPGWVTQEQIDGWLAAAGNEVGQLGQGVLSFSIASLQGAVTALIYLVLVPILVFFMLKDRESLKSSITGLLPTNRPTMNRVAAEMNQQIANYIRGKAIEIWIVGIVSFVTFEILGLNYSALLGLLVGLSVLIPFLGAAVATIPVLAVGFLQWGFSNEFYLLFFLYGLIQFLDGNLLVPLLFSEAVNLHPVSIILAVLVFGGLWGIWGVFFAIPLATLVKSLFMSWPRHNIKLEHPDKSE